MSFEMLAFDGLRHRRKGSKQVCGCTMEQTRRGVPMIVCPGVRRFASRAEAVALFRREQSSGSFCIFTTKRSKRGKRRSKRR